MINASQIKDINHAKEILDNIQSYVIAYEEQCGEVPEDVLENMGFQICEVDEFVIGAQMITSKNTAHAHIRMMTYWQYIDGKCSFWDMIGELKKYEGDI